MSNNTVIEPVTATATATRKVAHKASKPKASQKPKKAAAGSDKLDRLPTTLRELRDTKGGFVATLFLKGMGRDGIAKEVKAAFRLSEARAMKITRRITGRVRLYQRILELVAAK